MKKMIVVRFQEDGQPAQQSGFVSIDAAKVWAWDNCPPSGWSIEVNGMPVHADFDNEEE